MTQNNGKLLELWKRIEDARLQVHFAHSAIRKINRGRGGIPSPDGDYAFAQALRAETLAVKDHLRALEEYRAALVPTDQQALEHPITPRERQVLMLIASGKSSRAIAAELGIAFRTVVCHRYRLYQKLKVHTNVDLTRAAMRMGLVEL